MADIGILSRLVGAVQRNVDLQQNALLVGSLKVGTTSPVELTKTILTNLIALQNGSDFANGTNAHTHDGRYFTETELGSAIGTSGAERIGVKSTAANFIPSAANVEAWLAGIDAALASSGRVDFADDTFRISDNTTSSKKIAFQASGISDSTVRTITMPDADVNLGSLTNSNISATAAIAYSKLALSNSIVNGDVASAAAIAESKLALDFSTSSLNTNIGTRALDSVVIKKDGSVAFTAAQSMGGFKLTNVADPTANGDAVTLGYMNARLNGLTPKAPARAATTANITLSGAQTIDGVSVVAGNRVLVKNQTLPEENGIYVASASAWSRSADMNDLTPFDEFNGAWVTIQEGTQAGQVWVQYGNVATVNTDPVTFAYYNPIAGLIGGDMITFSGSTFSVDIASDGGLESSNPGNAAGQLRIKLDGSTLSNSSSGLKVATGGITNTEVSATAAIAYSKLNLASSIVDGDINASAAISYSKLALSNSIVNGDIATGAAIAYSKLNLATSIVNADINAGAAIAYSKLNLSASIVDADIASGAAIAYSKLALSNSITNADLTTGVADQSTITGGNGTALSVATAPVLRGAEVAGESFAASLFAVRFAKAADAGFVAGRMYKASTDASAVDNFYVVGLCNSAASAGNALPVTKMGPMTVTSHGFTVGAPLFLDSTGAVTETAPTAANSAVVRVGFAKTANIIEVQIQVVGVN
jgi:hypothetical protein